MALDPRPPATTPAAAVPLPLVRALRPTGPAEPWLRLGAGDPVVLLPDWPEATAAGAPHLLALLALWLAREGLPVLMHRPGAPGRAEGASAVLTSLGIAAAHDAAEVADRWARREPGWLASGRLAPPGPAGADWRLARPAGTRAVLPLVPCADAGDAETAARWARATGTLVLCLRGPFAAEARQGPWVDAWRGGERQPSLGLATLGEPLARWAPMPHGAGAATAAVWVQDVLSGARPLPEPLQRLARCVAAAWGGSAQPLAGDSESCL